MVTHDENIDFIYLFTAFLSHGTSGKSVFCRLFHFLSWAILKQNWFSLGAPMFCHQTWSSFSWSHKSFVGHAHWKSWFHIVFYSIFKPWAPLEKLVCFISFFTFSRERSFKSISFPWVFPCFLLIPDFHFHDLSSIFSSRTTKILISYCFLQHFGTVCTSEKLMFFYFFTFSRERLLNIISFSLGVPIIWVRHDLHLHDLSSHFLVTHDEILDFILYFTAFLRRGHL